MTSCSPSLTSCVSRRNSNQYSFSDDSLPLDVSLNKDLSGKIFLITGGTSGIGKGTAKALALRNATVVICGRGIVKAATFIEELIAEKPDARISFLYLDNAELQSVTECVERFLSIHKALHCLILNAGVYKPIHRITDDEFEATFQINYLAHFYLTKLLLPVLKASAPARVVVVASESHRWIGGNLNPDKVTWKHLSPTHKRSFNSSSYAYGLSKLCLILFSREFNRLYTKDHLVSNALHPGFTMTELRQNSKWLNFYQKITKAFAQTAVKNGITIS